MQVGQDLMIIIVIFVAVVFVIGILVWYNLAIMNCNLVLGLVRDVVTTNMIPHQLTPTLI
jgi:hypothetical protein